MRVVHVVPSLAARTGGTATSLVELSLGLAACGVESAIFATDLAEPPQARRHSRVAPGDLPAGADVADVCLFPAVAPRRLAHSPALRRALRSELRRCDVVHIHSLFLFPQFAAFTEARRLGRPYVVAPHGCFDPFLRRRGRARKWVNDRVWQRAMLAGASALQFGAEEEARLAADVVPPVRRVVVPNGIDWDAFGRLPDGAVFRERRLAGHAGPVVMHLGRIAEKKGVDVLIRAFARGRLADLDARLAVVGPDDDGLVPGLRALAERECVAERVDFVGLVRGGERLEALAAADVWALASRSDACSAAVIEALAAGRPTVLTPRINLAPEAARAAAAVVSPLDPDALGAELRALLEDDARRRELGESARAFAQRFDRRRVARRMIGVYEEAIA
jgi:glycosyltransferase involved in cell wall biosynthesis